MVTGQYIPHSNRFTVFFSMPLLFVMGMYDWGGGGGGSYTTHPQVSIETVRLTRFLSKSNISSSLSQSFLSRGCGARWRVKLDLLVGASGSWLRSGEVARSVLQSCESEKSSEKRRNGENEDEKGNFVTLSLMCFFLKNINKWGNVQNRLHISIESVGNI